MNMATFPQKQAKWQVESETRQKLKKGQQSTVLDRWLYFAGVVSAAEDYFPSGFAETGAGLVYYKCRLCFYGLEDS